MTTYCLNCIISLLHGTKETNLGIFDRLFKKKKLVITKKNKKTISVDETTKKKSISSDDDTRPIKLPAEITLKPVPIVKQSKTIPQKKVINVQKDAPVSGKLAMQDDEIDEAIDNSFDELFGDDFLEDVNDETTDKNVYELSKEELQRDREETRDLFGQIAVNYIKPVKQFMFELSRGSASSDWIPVCLPAIESMISSLKTMNLHEEEEVLDIFKTYLMELQKRNVRIIEGEYQKVAMDLYGHLKETFPQTFELGDMGVQREGIIIFSLLKQIPDVGKVTLDKLFAAGLSTLEMLFLATPRDLSRTTGIPNRLSEKICVKIQTYKEEYHDRPVDENHESINDMLNSIVGDLEDYHQLYEDLINEGWTDPDFNNKKKEYRKARQEASLKINVLLAEMGEVELVEKLERMPFDRRIEELKTFLASAQNNVT